MNCYVDSSILIRKLFDEPNPLAEWPTITFGFSSQLLRLECLRTIDRVSFRYTWSIEEKTMFLSDLQHLWVHIGLLPLTPHIMKRAEEPFATPVGSLDSIHLATALAWHEMHGRGFLFATHDQGLALAARAHGLDVIGI